MPDDFALALDKESSASGVASRLSPVPIIVAAAALALSVALIVIGRGWPLPIVGWVLTPFVVVGCLAWGRVMFLGRSADPWFDRADGRRKLRVLQILTAVAFAASLPHVWRIGQEAALWLQ